MQLLVTSCPFAQESDWAGSSLDYVNRLKTKPSNPNKLMRLPNKILLYSPYILDDLKRGEPTQKENKFEGKTSSKDILKLG